MANEKSRDALEGGGNTNAEPIAVVGIGCRFPGARLPEEFWRLLRDGGTRITEVPSDRFDIDALYDAMPGTPGKIASRWGGFIEGVDQFDAGFFGITRGEARAMDPQQRLALEVTWDALEDSGQAPRKLRGSSAGVFIGMLASEYGELEGRQAVDFDLTGNVGRSRNATAGRVSYLLGVEGPSMVVDTDRSSSLVAVHLASQSLRSGECDLAIAGGTNLVLSPGPSLSLSRAGMLAPDGKCKFCDARADGIVRSDGVGVVVLKPLRAALANGDRIYAVILGSAVNHDGGRSGDLMSPSSASQAALLRAACRNAKVSPVDVQYVEAHGPGTPVGDPMEIAALADVLQHGRIGEPLRVGSVKTNIGHAEAAAGIAGLIKVALSIRHRMLPASLHFETPNPNVNFDGIVVQSRLSAWPDETKPLIAGVTSLGLTGTNAHVLLGSPPPVVATEIAAPGKRAEIVVLSARSSPALVALARTHVEALRAAGEGIELYDVAFHSAMRRDPLECRLAIDAESCDELARELEAFVATGQATGLGPAKVKRPKVAFVFPGHGSQWIGMGRELLASEPVFRQSIEECDASIRRVAGWSLIEELASDGAASRLGQIDIVQPVLIAIEVSIARLWRSWGIEPDAIVGTSMGEVAAAHVAGILSLDDAMRIICRRTSLMRRLHGKGAMAVVELPLADARALIYGCEDRVSIAASNSPGSTVLSGDPEMIDKLLEQVRAKNIFGQPIKIEIASHSPQMDALTPELLKVLAELQPQKSRVSMYSCVTGKQVAGPELDASYWARNLREPVLLTVAAQNMIEHECTVFVEMSPHPILVGSILDCLAHADQKGVALGSLVREKPERRSMLRSLGVLFAQGCGVDWQRLLPVPGRWVDLPLYPWQHEKYWHGQTKRAYVEPGSMVPAAITDGERPLETRAATRRPPSAFLAQQLQEATPGERRERLREYIKGQVAKILCFGTSDRVDPKRSFRELGLSSAMAVELRSVLGRSLGRALPASLLFNHANIDALVDHLAEGDAELPPVGMLGEILVDCRILTESQLKLALVEQARAGKKERLGAVLLRLGLITTENLQLALARQVTEPIAIIGMACRFPGGISSPSAFWDVLHNGIDVIREVPSGRWDVDAFYDPGEGKSGKMRSKWGGFIDDIGSFDAGFFGISPRESEEMDPQHRLLLEVTWEALERAGQAPVDLLGSRTGVFVGIMNNNDYAGLKRLADDPSRVRAHHGTGTATSIAAGRLAYSLGLSGPTLAVDTACSSSLVATHLAIQSLRNGECQMALAGGVNVILSPELSIAYSQSGMLSPEGRCKTFDASADGYVRSEGCGVVVLKRLSDALADGDNVLALLTGSAVNQDGRSSGLTAPNGRAQESVIREAQANAGVMPAQIMYVEAHGTGTPLGDPIEVAALGAVLKKGRAADKPFVLGSVKTNMGHLEAASGMAGLMKIILALQNEEIPPNLHLKTLNPHIVSENAPMVVPVVPRLWPAGPERRIAGISSFGFSGTNAHFVVEEAPPRQRTPSAEQERSLYLLPLSAKDAHALDAQIAQYVEHFNEHPEQSFADVCYTASVGRGHFEERLAVTASSLSDAAEKLSAYASGMMPDGVVRSAGAASSPPKIALLFTGQGSQYVGMGRDLYEAEPIFRNALNRCAQIIDSRLERPLLEVIYPAEGVASPLDETEYTQVAIFALEYSLYELWRTWGVTPDAVCGHSIGQYVAACVAGVFSLEDGLKLVAARGRLMQALPRDGAMVAVAASLDDVNQVFDYFCGGDVAIAAVNSATQVVLSGQREAVRQVCAVLEVQGVKTNVLQTSHAFHSALMDPMLDEFERVFDGVTLNAPTVTLICNLTGDVVTDQVKSARYWVRHAREAVQFARGMQTLDALGIDTYLELGPHPTLIALGAACLPDGKATWLSSLRKSRPSWPALLKSLASLYVQGMIVEWRGFDRPHVRSRVLLPTYPFQRKHYWVHGSQGSKRRTSGGHPLLGESWTSSVQSGIRYWQTELSCDGDLAYLVDHVVEETLVVPGSAYVEIASALAREHYGDTPVAIEEIAFERALVLSREEPLRIQLTTTEDGEGQLRFQLSSHGDGSWRRHATGRIRKVSNDRSAAESLDAIRARCGEPTEGRAFYEGLKEAERGLPYGPAFQGVVQLYRGPDEALAQIRLPDAAGDAERYLTHPALLDAVFQVLFAALPEDMGPGLMLPVAIQNARMHQRLGGHVWSHVRIRPDRSARGVVGDVVVYDAEGQVLAEIEGLAFTRAPRETFLRESARTAVLPFYQLGWREAAEAAPSATVAPGRWLVLSDSRERSRALCERLQAEGGSWVEGNLDPSPGPESALMMKEIVASASAPVPLDGVVCWWSDEGPNADSVSQAEHRAVVGLHVVQALAGASGSRRPRLILATERTQAVTSSDVVSLASSVLWGLGRTVVQEHPELPCRMIDLEPGPVAADALLREMRRDDDERQVAWRSGKRHVARLERAAPDVATRAPIELGAGTVLVTGGLGALGLCVARWLVEVRGARHLVLLGRSAPTGDRLALVDEIRKLGASVIVARADVANLEELRAVVDAIPSEAPLRGVIHAAGVAEDVALLRQDRAGLERTFASKVRGGWNLHELTKGRALDFLVMFSSSSALFGWTGHGDYAAANGFLDALTHWRRAQGLPGSSINWGGWSGGGMNERRGEELARLDRLGLGAITPAQGLDLLGRALARTEPQLAALQLDLAAVRKAMESHVPPFWQALIRPAAAAQKPGKVAANQWATEVMALPPELQAAHVQTSVRAEIAKVLGLSSPLEVSVDRPLQELGLDSLTAVEVRGALAAIVGGALPATLLFDFPTVAKLSTFILTQLAPAPKKTAEKAARAKRPETRSDEPIAIVGMACRYPGGVTDPESLWRLLINEGDAIGKVPKERWDVDAFYDADTSAAGKMSTRQGGFVDHVDLFDPEFFGISPREAQSMDPQQRLLLETSWEALEAAGIPPQSLMDTNAGVFVGIMYQDYRLLSGMDPRRANGYLVTGTVPSVASGRISYVLGLKGPSITVDTACSTSLVTTHLACQSLRANECDVALTGGATLVLAPTWFIDSGRLGLLAPDGRCKSFDAAADGVGWSEGCGMLVLKRLSDAVRDGNPVLALILGGAVNQDGRSQGMTAPNGPSQQAVIERAMRQANVRPDEIGYVECHGTGTKLGDPIEVQALGAALQEGRDPNQDPVIIGSLKSNVGHTQAAAGVGGIIKTVLALRNGMIPRSLHFSEPNPRVSWAELPLKVAEHAVPWARGARRRVAGVSSFGVSGTNAHIILAESEEEETS